MKQIDRYTKYNDQIVDTSNGEIVDIDQLKKAVREDLVSKYKESNKMMIDLGIHLDVKVIKDKLGEPYDSINLKENHEFNKIFRVDVNFVFENSELNAEAFAFIGRFSSSLHFPSNTVMLNGIHPTQEEMAEALRIGRTKLNSALKQLEFYDVIKRKKINGKTYIYFNPFLYSTGLIAVDTYKLFRESAYNPCKSVDSMDNNKEEGTRKKRPKPLKTKEIS